MNPLVQRLLTSALRSGLLIVAGWFIKKGWLSEADGVELAAEVAAALAVILWGFWSHYKSLQKENTTIAVLNKMTGPDVPNVTSADITEIIKSGDAASTLTPTDTVPRLTGTGAGLNRVMGTGNGLGIVLAIGLSVGALAGCAHGTNLSHIPSTPVTVADAEGRRNLAKVVRVLDSLGDFTADLSTAERSLHDGGSVPDSWHQNFRVAITGFARRGLDVLDRIEKGLASWVEIRPLLEGLIADANRLIDLINSAPSKARSVLSEIFDQVTTAFGEFAFGGSR